MRYQPLDAEVKNDYLNPNWKSKDMKRVVKYYSSLRFFEHIPFKDWRGIDMTEDLFQ